MSDLDDLDLHAPQGPGHDAPEAELERVPEPELEAADGRDARDFAPAPTAERFPIGLAAAAAAMVGLVVAIGYVVLRPSRTPRPLVSASPAASAQPAPAASATPSAAPSPESIALPSLDDSDGVVRELATRLSAHPQLPLWLGANDLVRRFSAVIVNVASGENPRPHAAYLAPREGFRVTSRQGRLVVDPAAYARYDALADGVASLDAAGCAHVYRLLSPLLDAAARELGQAEGGFDGVLATAVTSLLAVPLIEGDVPLRPVTRAIVLYEYADARLESLTPAQKQLLRMGPRNVRKVQDKLREMSAALGLKLGARP